MLHADPNTIYENKSLGTWSSTTDVDNFFNTYNAENGWDGLKLGNYVTIQDGTTTGYNNWMIVGFDIEHNQTAADGTLYDNGYGICMIPELYLYDGTWNDTATLEGGYINSAIHNKLNSTIANKLKTVLGDHLVLRNVLLSNGYATQGTKYVYSYATGYTWTTAYLTLLSLKQCVTDTFSDTGLSYKNIYDVGEANYTLPYFKYYNSTLSNPKGSWSGRSGYKKSYYLRNISYSSGTTYTVGITMSDELYVNSSMQVYNSGSSSSWLYGCIRPMIYIR